MATQHQLTSAVEGISCHAWNADRSMIAICPNNNEIHIYDCQAIPWNRIHTLTEHDLLVTALDWCPINNRIVSCSHDRNAFVWTYDRDVITNANYWKPALVILRIDRAALDVKWSLDGLRFAVTSGSKCVPVCTFEVDNEWWVSTMIKKKFKSTVLCCAFHPHNGQLLATGCADFKCRVFSTFVAKVDGSAVNSGPFGRPLEFGEAYVELSALGWVNAVAWSPSGDTLAFAGHDSTVHFAQFPASSAPVVQTVRLSFLPMRKLLFISERVIAAAGHDFKPAVFTNNANGWTFLQFLEKSSLTRASSDEGSGKSEGVAAARALFRSKTALGQDSAGHRGGDAAAANQPHENVITDLHTVRTGNTISTSGLDGRVVVWELPALGISMATLGL